MVSWGLFRRDVRICLYMYARIASAWLFEVGFPLFGTTAPHFSYLTSNILTQQDNPNAHPNKSTNQHQTLGR